MRQYGLQQPIPQDPPNFDDLHKMDLRGKNDHNWPQKHHQWITMWNDWQNHLVQGIPDHQPLYPDSQYMQWYLQRTRRYVSPDGAYSLGAYNFASKIRDRTAPPHAFNNPINTINDVHFDCNDMITALANLNPSAFSTNYQQPPPTQQFGLHESYAHDHTEHPPQTPNPQYQQQQSYGFGGFASCTPHHSFSHAGSSSHFEGSTPSAFYLAGSSSQYPGLAPSSFAAQPGTPWSAFTAQDCYRPTMPSDFGQASTFGTGFTDHGNQNVDEDDNEDDDEDEEEEEEQPQLIRGGRRRRQPSQGNDQVRRVQPARTRRAPTCGTSSHRRH